MARVLVTGSDDRVSAVAGLLRDEGHEVVTAGRAEDLPGGNAPFDHYLQLPVAVRPTGDHVVGRVRSFLTGGLLARFALVEHVLDRLADGATVVLVSGNTPEGAALPDDEQSRLALLHVLAHATRAELAARGVGVTVASGGCTDAELVRYALQGGEDPRARLVTEPPEPLSEVRYEDWRTEVMGLVQYHG
ncbi:MAG TPA: hypothetical protein VM367_06645 [Pseudonocardia sp.]|jgi:NAD(P)-dependent dehydrogenase (short-subunit alcohol dehydrogenase family)|nr:hypothetical protein [Pseudonocardia sp.]